MAELLLETLFSFFTSPANFLLVVLGVMWGILFGSLPGLNTTTSLALLVPLTFSFDPGFAIVFLISAYSSGIYGGSLSAILMNIPGTPSAIATTFDGYPMASQKKKPGIAIGYATISSGIGALLGCVILALFAPILARFALRFSNQEYVGLALFGLSILAYISPKSTFKGLIAGIIGLFLGTIGSDSITGLHRFSFGIGELMSGIHIVPLTVGLFGLSEVLIQLETKERVQRELKRITRVLPSLSSFKRMWKTLLRSSIIGTAIGAIPAAGSSIAVMVAYAQEKRASSHPEKLGTGVPEGIVAPEAANNSSMGGALIPMLTLGIPGDPMTAVLIGAFMIHGIRPGPQLFRDHLGHISTIYVAFFLAILVTTLLGLLGAKYFAKLLDLPRFLLLPIIVILAVIGSFSIANSLFDVTLMILFGVMGYLMRKIDMPQAPVILGLILGPILEDNFRRSLLITRGDIFTFFKRPISCTLIIVALLTLLYPLLKKEYMKYRARRSS